MFQDGTATGGGVDYVSDPGIITFGPGETLQCIYVNITNDLTAEVDEVMTCYSLQLLFIIFLLDIYCYHIWSNRGCGVRY